ncbi:MAG: hypothetical protein HYX38_10490 [Rhodospirillales bacterium]|nr:hypothetical protein [Rhodospirillales bacterium]
MAFSIRSPIWACLAFALAACLVAVAPQTAQANVLTKLLGGIDDVGRAGARGAARTAEEAALAAARAARMRGAPGASVLMAEGETLKLVVRTETETITKTVRSASDVTNALAQSGITAIYVPEEFLSQVRPLLMSMPDAKNVRLLRKDSTAVRIEHSQTGRLLAQVDDGNLFVELHSVRDLDTYSAVAHTRVARSQVDVYSLFDPREIDVVRYLDRGAGDAHRAVKPGDASTLANDIARRSSDKLVVIVGHIEETSLVMRGTQGEALARLSISELESSVAGVGKNVLVLGCESACVASSGYLSPVNVKAVAEALSVVRFGGTHGELLAALAKASPDGLVVTASFLNDARLFVAARAKAEKGALANQAIFNRVRVAAAVPGAWMKPVSATLLGFLSVLEILGIIWLFGLFNCVFQLKTTWRAWNDQSTEAGDSYASPLRQGLIRTRKLAVFLLVFPYLAAAEVSYLLSVAGIAAGSIVILALGAGDATGTGFALSTVASYALVLFAWRKALQARPLLATVVGPQPLVPLLKGWRDYLTLYAATIGLPLILAASVIQSVTLESNWPQWAMMLEAIPISIVAFVLLLRACRQSGIGPYELPIAAAVCLYQWLRWSRKPKTLKPIWLACSEAWREE